MKHYLHNPNAFILIKLHTISQVQANLGLRIQPFLSSNTINSNLKRQKYA